MCVRKVKLGSVAESTKIQHNFITEHERGHVVFYTS